MVNLTLYIVLGICLAVVVWQLVVWLGEVRSKNRKYRIATAYALSSNKPLLVAGGPWGGKRFRHWIRMPAHGDGDVCLDIDYRAIRSHPHGVVASITHIPFSDKQFGAAYASHTLEHLRTTDDARQALDELHRVAEAVFIVHPSRQSIFAWLIPGHHLWIRQEGNKTYLKQRGRVGGKNKEEYIVETA